MKQNKISSSWANLLKRFIVIPGPQTLPPPATVCFFLRSFRATSFGNPKVPKSQNSHRHLNANVNVNFGPCIQREFNRSQNRTYLGSCSVQEKPIDKERVVYPSLTSNNFNIYNLVEFVLNRVTLRNSTFLVYTVHT